MSLDPGSFLDEGSVSRLSYDEQCSVIMLREVADHLIDQPHTNLQLHQREAIDGLARDLNIFLRIFVKARERLCTEELPDDSMVSSDSEESLELPTMKKDLGLSGHSTIEISLPDPSSSSSDFSLLDSVKAEWFPIFPLEEARTEATTAKEYATNGSFSTRPFSIGLSSSSSSSSSISSILEITRQDSNGEYHRIDHNGSKNGSSLNLFEKAKAKLNNGTKKQSSDSLDKEPGNDKSLVREKSLVRNREGSGSSTGKQPALRRVRRKISRGDRVDLTEDVSMSGYQAQ